MTHPRTGFQRVAAPSKHDVRRVVMARDDQRCGGCGAKKNLTLHHIVPLSNHGAALDPDNLETLCRECHDKRHPYG